MTRTVLAISACALLLAGGVAFAAPAAGADGLPLLGVDAGLTGVTTPTAAQRYVTIGAGHRTIVARVQRNGGQVLRSSSLRGTFTVPAVAFDGTAGGLSADQRTLVLIHPRQRFPRRSTPFVVLDPNTLRIRRHVTLAGDFSFDAISPDGRSMFLVEYTSRRDPTRYQVRSFDLREGRLRRAPIVDPRERDEAMRGFPITRSVSPDGRWAYTLYDGAGKGPFVHALDTSRGRAACIDLDGVKADYALRLRPNPDGGRLDVIKGPRPLATIDTRTFAVSSPAVAAQSGSHADAWIAGGAAAVLLGGGAFSVARRLRRRPAMT